MGVKTALRKMHFLRNIYYKIQLKQYLSKLPKEVLKNNSEELKKLKGKYAGKRCFIIGNGPSLTVEDLDKLRYEITFGSNRIFTIYGKTEWRPTFYANQDQVVLENMLNELRDTVSQSEIAFISAHNYTLSSEKVENLNKVLWVAKRFCSPKNNRYAFSDDVSKEVIEGLTITYTCIQIAAYMGFSEIYLLGIDHNYPIEIDDDGNIVKNDDSVKAYFGDAMVSMSDINLPKVVEMTRAYISAQKHSEKNGYKIFNATRGGKLEVFPRVDFDSLF